MHNDRESLRFLKKLSPDKLIETDLALILPAGAPGYALDGGGNVVGLKLGSIHQNANRILATVVRLRNLKRLVLSISEPCNLPASIEHLRNLDFLWLDGKFKTLPKELLSLGLPIYWGNFSIGSEDFGRFLDKRITLTLVPPREEEEHRNMSDYTPAVVESEIDKEKYMRTQLSESDRAAILGIRGIFLSEIKVEDPPVEIVAKGRDAIARYFNELGSDALPLNELKVLLVGNGSAGKTSLVKRIIGEDFDAEESQTHGINIRTWYKRSREGKEVKLNFWDFGGQEIMHATHQFFLSKRSMYILVLDGRKEEDPEYWLQHIESFGGDSPVMVILNKIDEHPSFDVNRRFLSSKYRGIFGFFRISCATGSGISDFSEELADVLDKTPMLQTLWPKDWFNVKQRLERLNTAYVSLSEYRTICQRENVTEEENQELLVDFLNDLGVVLHFKDIELLDTHVLDPLWVTEAVYRIINSDLLAKQKGILQLNQLGEALKSRTTEGCVYATDKHHYIVDLMLKF